MLFIVLFVTSSYRQGIIEKIESMVESEMKYVTSLISGLSLIHIFIAVEALLQWENPQIANLEYDEFSKFLEKILEEGYEGEELKQILRKNIHELIPKHITKEDILASINYNIHLEYGLGNDDDIDHLGNRRIRSVGELLQNRCV